MKEHTTLQSRIEMFVSAALNGDADAILSQIADVACLCMNASYVAITTRHDDGRAAHFVRRGMAQADVVSLLKLPMGSGVVGSPRHGTAYLGVPFYLRDELAGALYVTQPVDRGVFDTRDRLFIRSLVGLLSEALEVADMASRLNAVTIEHKREALIAAFVEAIGLTAQRWDSMDEMLNDTLLIICDMTDVSVGHIYRRVTDNTLVSSQLWYTDDPHRYDAFKHRSEDLVFVPGEGLPGRVLQSGSPTRIPRLDEDPNFLRSAVAERAHLRSAFAVPVPVDGCVMAVVECFSSDETTPDDELLCLMHHIGVRVGQAV